MTYTPPLPQEACPSLPFLMHASPCTRPRSHLAPFASSIDTHFYTLLSFLLGGLHDSACQCSMYVGHLHRFIKLVGLTCWSPRPTGLRFQVGISNVLCILGFQSPWILIQFGWFVSWIYLRFYKRTIDPLSGLVTYGDRSETFAFIQWFPPFVQ